MLRQVLLARNPSDGRVVLVEERLHVLELLVPRLRVKGVENRYAGQVERHKDEVRLRPDVLDAHGPDLRDDDGSDGATGGCEVESPGSEVGREDLER
jgi:hypothetical protein